MEVAMKVAKWGNSLAIRLPAELVARLGLVEGDELDVVTRDKTLEVQRVASEADRQLAFDRAFENLRSLKGRLPADFKFDREEANSRGRDDPD
jgi:antitoxin MazE